MQTYFALTLHEQFNFNLPGHLWNLPWFPLQTETLTMLWAATMSCNITYCCKGEKSSLFKSTACLLQKAHSRAEVMRFSLLTTKHYSKHYLEHNLENLWANKVWVHQSVQAPIFNSILEANIHCHAKSYKIIWSLAYKSKSCSSCMNLNKGRSCLGRVVSGLNSKIAI